MWMVLSLPILFILFGGMLVSYGIIVAFSIGLKILVFVIIGCISIGFICLISIPYIKCESKLYKIMYCFGVSVILFLLLIPLISVIKLTNISVVNDSQNEIITEVTMVPVGNDYQTNENEILTPNIRAYRIRSTEEITDKSRRLGLNYEKGDEWFRLKDHEKEIVGGLWYTECFTAIIPKGSWIITLKTYNPTTGKYYSVIYNKNVFCTHLGEQLKFSYSGKELSLVEHTKSPYMPEAIDKHLKKELSKKFQPNLIVITKESEGIFSKLSINDKAQFTTFPELKRGDYTFYSLIPDNTYLAKFSMSIVDGIEVQYLLKEEKDLFISKKYTVMYIDEWKKEIQQIQSNVNYEKFQL